VHGEDCEENGDGDECGPEGERREQAELARGGQDEYCSAGAGECLCRAYSARWWVLADPALTGWANVCRTYRRSIPVDADGASRVIFYSFEGKQK
jgi:hypothetical protein